MKLHLQIGAQLWIYMINATGGAIAFHNSGLQMLAIDDSSFPTKVKETPSREIWLKNSFGSKSKIEKMSTSMSNKGLRYLHAIDGNMNQEYHAKQNQAMQNTGIQRSIRKINNDRGQMNA